MQSPDSNDSNDLNDPSPNVTPLLFGLGLLALFIGIVIGLVIAQ
jgi:hypothetical protein